MKPIKKIAFCASVKELTDPRPFENFLKNAQKFGHKIDSLIIVYTEFADSFTVEELEQYCNVYTLKAGSRTDLSEINENEIIADVDLYYFLFDTIDDPKKVPYGTIRNTILTVGIILDLDILLFVEPHAIPKILHQQNEDQYYFSEVDFVKSHIAKLDSTENNVMTTSSFTGFSYLPKFNFENMQDLLIGLQKEDLNDFLLSCEVNSPRSQDHTPKYYMDTAEMYCGNIGLDLRKLHLINPFYSATLDIGGEIYLGYPDQEIFAPASKKNEGRCIDIDMRIFQDLYRSYPEPPSIDDERAVNFFYEYSLGQVIRNPFMNWLRDKYYPKTKGKNSNFRYRSIVTGSEFAAEHFSDNRFMHLPIAFELAYQQLPENIEKYKSIYDSWQRIVSKLS